jgi:HAE1 family hydrophobic/amphiphilic exporter-1
VWLTRFAITRPVITAMVFIGLAVYGVMSYFALGVSLFPNVAFPIAIVVAGYPGAAPAEMEKLVVKPIEDQLDGMENMDQMRAIIQEGTAVVIARFKLDTDLNFETIDVQRRVETARVNMPSDLDPPSVDKASTSDSIIVETLRSKKMSLAALSDLVTDRILPELKSVKGVSTVDTSGDAQREIHVFPDQSKLLGTQTTLADINGALAINNANLPGGRMDTPTLETTVSLHADIVQPQDILLIPLTTLGSPQFLRIGDVAQVDDGHVEIRRPSHFNGLNSIRLDINRQNDADELKTTEGVRAKFADLKTRFPDVTFFEVEANADYTRASIDGVLQSLLEGIFLTAIVMLLFLHAWRNALVVMISIPTSLLATFVVMKLMGFTVDLISMMGLGLTIGILVDDSIVVLENITRHRDMGEKPLDAAYTGRTEIGQAAITITLVDVVVFLPIAFLSGIVGKYMKEFGVVIVVATLFSLFVSFTLTPLLAGRWSVKRRSPAVPPWARWFQRGFDALARWYTGKALPWALEHRVFVPFACAVLVLDSLTLVFPPINLGSITLPGAVVINAAIVGIVIVVYGASSGLSALFGWVGRDGKAPFVGALRRPFKFVADRWMSSAFVAVTCLAMSSIFLWPKIGTEFIPAGQPGVLRGTLTYHIGTPLATTGIGMARLEKELLKIDAVDSVSSVTGAKPSGFGSVIGGHVARFTVILDKKRRKETDRVLEDARKLAWTVPGAVYQVQGEGGDPIAFTLSGPDTELEAGANKLVAFIDQQKGAVNAQSAAEAKGPRLNIHIDPLRSALLGIQPGQAALAARIAIGGVVSTKVRLPSGLTDVRLELPEAQRNSLATIKQIQIRAASGQLVPLASVADFSETIAPTKIERLNRERVIRVTAGVDPTQHVTQGDLVPVIQKQLNTPGFLPAGVRYIAEGDTDLLNQTVTAMLIAFVTSAVLVYMLMVVLYGSFVEPFIIMFSVPVAIVGALVGIAIRHQTMNLFSMIAIVMLYGLVSKNGILLVDYANQQRKKGLDLVAAMKEAAHVRFRPILMTTCAMVFGMLPLSLGLTEGAEERASMGTVLIGGLISSLILTLALVPVMYTWIMGAVEGGQRRKAAKRALFEEHMVEPGDVPVQATTH